MHKGIGAGQTGRKRIKEKEKGRMQNLMDPSNSWAQEATELHERRVPTSDLSSFWEAVATSSRWEEAISLVLERAWAGADAETAAWGWASAGFLTRLQQQQPPPHCCRWSLRAAAGSSQSPRRRSPDWTASQTGACRCRGCRRCRPRHCRCCQPGHSGRRSPPGCRQAARLRRLCRRGAAAGWSAQSRAHPKTGWAAVLKAGRSPDLQQAGPQQHQPMLHGCQEAALKLRPAARAPAVGSGQGSRALCRCQARAAARQGAGGECTRQGAPGQGLPQLEHSTEVPARRASQGEPYLTRSAVQHTGLEAAHAVHERLATDFARRGAVHAAVGAEQLAGTAACQQAAHWCRRWGRVGSRPMRCPGSRCRQRCLQAGQGGRRASGLTGRLHSRLDQQAAQGMRCLGKLAE